MQKAVVTFVMAICVLGMLGGCLIVAGSGFTTSTKHGEFKTFVPVPQAYLAAAIMYALSGVALIWLLQQWRARLAGYLVGIAVYVGAAVTLAQAMR